MKVVLDAVHGDVVEALFAFQESERTGPETLLVHLRVSGWRYGFPEWGQTFFGPLDDEDLASMIEHTYAGVARVDYAGLFGLIGAVVVRIGSPSSSIAARS